MRRNPWIGARENKFLTWGLRGNCGLRPESIAPKLRFAGSELLSESTPLNTLKNAGSQESER